MSEQGVSTYGERRFERDCDALAKEFHGIWSRETIVRFVLECHEELQARGRGGYVNFAGLLAARFAHERLLALGQAEGRIEKTKPEVLFVCVRTAGRSQMAAALTYHVSDGSISVRSAGSQPGEQIHPVVVDAMREIGIDIHEEFPKPLTDEVVRAADVVVTMGCGDACPLFPGKRYEDWDVADPDGQPMERVRLIRDDIKQRVQALVDSLVPATNV